MPPVQIWKIPLLLSINRISDDEFRLAYERGRSIGEYNIDCQLQKQAEAGDIESASLLDERVEKRKIRKLREDLFGI